MSMSAPFRSPRAKLEELAKCTLSRIPIVIAESEPLGSSYKSTLYRESSPLPLRESSTCSLTVRNIDTLSAGRALLGPESQNYGHVACINMANADTPGGTWLCGTIGQEEMLCSRSTLHATLNPEYYPLTGAACVWSPHVVVFRHELNPIEYTMLEYESFEERFLLGIVSVSAIFQPACSADQTAFVNAEDQALIDSKIRLVLRVLAKHKQTHIVLGALGCGAFRNPPRLIARTFKRVLAEREWEGYFREIVFAVMDSPDGPNISAFREVFEQGLS